jgi:hypothetical protein
MATSFMTEEEAESIIESKLEEILSKVRCSTSNPNESSMSTPGLDPDTGTTCGCCV